MCWAKVAILMSTRNHQTPFDLETPSYAANQTGTVQVTETETITATTTTTSISVSTDLEVYVSICQHPKG